MSGFSGLNKEAQCWTALETAQISCVGRFPPLHVKAIGPPNYLEQRGCGDGQQKRALASRWATS